MILSKEILGREEHLKEHLYEYIQQIKQYTTEAALLHPSIFGKKLQAIEDRIKVLAGYVKTLEVKIKNK